MKKKLMALLLLYYTIQLNAQTENQIYPEVGKPMPDFTLRNIKYYAKKEATLKDFLGKWLVLDFWNKYCGACVTSFPSVSTMQKELSDKVQVMMVGIQDPENDIQPMYAKYREKENLVMPCAFDSLIANRFDISAGPHSIIIDDKSIVRAITSSVNLNDMKGFLSDNPPSLPRSYRRMHDDKVDSGDREMAYDSQIPFLINNNGGIDSVFLFRSLLSLWDGNINPQATPSKLENRDGRFECLGVVLAELYNYAYFGQDCINGWSSKDTLHYGKYYPYPVLEIKDSSKFKNSYKYSKNIFSYSLIMPKEGCTVEKMQASMQRDLQNYFGYDAFIETRNCPYWKLVSTKKAAEKLKTKGGATSWNGIAKAGFTVVNYPFGKISNWLRDFAVNHEYFVDETGITGSVDMTLDCIPHLIDDVKQALKANGLELIRAEKEMKVLVIRDAK